MEDRVGEDTAGDAILDTVGDKWETSQKTKCETQGGSHTPSVHARPTSLMPTCPCPQPFPVSASTLVHVRPLLFLPSIPTHFRPILSNLSPFPFNSFHTHRHAPHPCPSTHPFPSTLDPSTLTTPSFVLVRYFPFSLSLSLSLSLLSFRLSLTLPYSSVDLSKTSVFPSHHSLPVSSVHSTTLAPHGVSRLKRESKQ